MAKNYRVVVTPEAERLLKALDPAVFQFIQNGVRRLMASPELGKPLTGNLKGFRAWKVSRYRIVYSLLEKRETLVLVGTGLRKEGDKRDIYNLLQRLEARGLLEDLIRYLEGP